jgi:hypothetical protein
VCQRKICTTELKYGLQETSSRQKMLSNLKIENWGASAFWPGTNFSGYFEFMLTIEIKDGRYRYFVEDLKHVSYKNGCSGGNLSQEKPLGSTFLGTAPNKKGWQKIKNDGYESVSLLIKSLTEEMNKSTPKDDW